MSPLNSSLKAGVLIGALLLASVSSKANIYAYSKNGLIVLSDKQDKRVLSQQVFATPEKTKSVPVNKTQPQNNSFNQSVMAAVPRSLSSRSSAYADLIEKTSNAFQVESKFVHAIIHTESSYNPNAVSPVGAQGLMQLMPATARRFGVTNPYNPEQNIQGGVSYLRWLLNRYNGNMVLAAAAYNAGEGRVDQYRGVPPYKETREYVRKVMQRYSGGAMPMMAQAVVVSNTTQPNTSIKPEPDGENDNNRPKMSSTIKISGNKFSNVFN